MESGRSRIMAFSLGAAIGSAVGLILGSLLTYWIGDETIKALSSKWNRQPDQPNFEKLLQ
jgi:membrane protein YqaA with SNARE-associated domain